MINLLRIGKKLTEAITGYVERPAEVRIPNYIEQCFMLSKCQKLYMHLCANPCSWLRKISKELNYSLSTTVLHLQNLVDAGFVTAQRYRNKVLYYPTGLVEKEDIMIVLTFNESVSKKIFSAIYNRPGITSKELTSALGISLSSVKRGVRQLVSLRLVTGVRDGPSLRFYPTERIDDMHQKYKQLRHSFIKSLITKFRYAGLSPRIETTIGQKIMVRLIAKKSVISLLLNTNPVRFP